MLSGRRLASCLLLLLLGFLLGLIAAPYLIVRVMEGEAEQWRKRAEECGRELEELRATVEELRAQLEEKDARIRELESKLEAGAPTLTVIVLPNRLYYSTIRRFIERANHSVYVAVYAVKYDPKEHDDPVNILLETLVEARERGLDVKVLVDDVTYESYRDTIEFLKSNGVPVKLDPEKGVRTHVKMVIVDGKCLFVGSHNWTESALSYNNEYSVLIISEEHAGKAESYFMKLWKWGRIP